MEISSSFNLDSLVLNKVLVMNVMNFLYYLKCYYPMFKEIQLNFHVES